MVLTTIEQLFRPEALENLGQANIILKIWKGGQEYEEVVFDIPSFYTLEDIKRQFYMLHPDASRLPRFVFMGIAHENMMEGLEYNWYDKYKKLVPMQYPSKTINKPDKRWANDLGEPMYPNLIRRDRTLIEDIFEEEVTNNTPITINVYQLTELMRAYTGVKPIADIEWHRRIGCFFPDMAVGAGPTEEDIEEARYITTLVTKREERVVKLNAIIEAGYPTYPFMLRGIQRIALRWNKAPPGFEGCEMFFYETPVTHERPFIRLLGATGQPVNKVFVKGIVPIPDIPEPDLLRQWSREQSPEDEGDFVFTKNILREEKEGLSAVFGTMRVYNKGSADYIIVPPKKERVLEAMLDLRDFSEKIEMVTTGTRYSAEDAVLGDGSFIFTMTINLDDPKITSRILAKKLPCFAPFFYLIKPYVSDMPQMMLRYKTVSNFVKEGIVPTYITYLSERARIRGAGTNPYEWIDRIAEEFNIAKELAKKHVEDWIANRSVFMVAKEEDIYEGKNPGIDIAIYEHHPQYHVHILGVNRPMHLQRIITLLQQLFAVPEEEFSCTGTAALEKAQTVLEVERDVIAPQPDQPVPLAEPIQGTPAAMNADDNVYNFDPNLLYDPLADEVDANALDTDEVDANAVDTDADKGEGAEVEAGAAGQDMIQTMRADITQIKKQFEAASAPPAPPSTSHHAREIVSAEEGKGQAIQQEDITSRDAPVLHKYIIELLKKKDPALFDYDRIGKQNGYSRKCPSNSYAQPIVLTYDDFMKNYNTYINDIDVRFSVYPYEQRDLIPEGTEEYTFLRYGSDPKKDLFYTCPTLFCIRDSMIVRPGDFESNRDRAGNPKPRNTCPFCRGRPIEDEKHSNPNYTVIVRKTSAEDGKVKKYIGFHRSNDHPMGLGLPCCFVSSQDKGDKPMILSNPRFDVQREWIRKGVFRNVGMGARPLRGEADADMNALAEYEETMTVATTMREERLKPYLVLFSSMHNEYIQNPEKMLTQGSLGLLPPSLEDYFMQDNKRVAKPIKARQSLLPTSEGFLRVGVGNLPKYKADSLLLVLAPILGRTSLREVKEYLLQIMHPYFFVQLNYGNLVHEFNDPSYPLPPGGEEAVMSWAATVLQMDRRAENRASAIRIWKAFNRFRDHILSEDEPKELRVFGPIISHAMLTQNTLNGCLLVVIEYDVSAPEKPVTVLCPSYGISPHAKEVADICFVARTREGFYEPIVYTKNRPASVGVYAQHLYTLKWQRAEQAGWPELVKRRVNEFMIQCEGPGRSIYPSQVIDQYSLIGMSALRDVANREMPGLLRGIVREAYNHVAALLFSPTAESNSYVAVPCVDDGVLLTSMLQVALDWRGYNAAPINEVVEFYEKYILTNFALYKGYKVVRAIQEASSPGISAARLENGLFIPAGAARAAITLPLQKVMELQWVQDERIAHGDSVMPKMDITMNWINELYQHFRLSFSNWLVRAEQVESRRMIEKILKDEAAAKWDKWKRLDIMLRGTLIRWFDDDTYSMPGFSMLRKDCISITEEGECSGSCKWRSVAPAAEDAEAEVQQEGRCYLHIPKMIQSKKQQLSVSELYMFRLYDDLIRFPRKRDEIMDGNVPRLTIPTEAILVEDQWILPETSATWTELLRAAWAKSDIEKPRYYEEMSASEEERAQIAKGKRADFLETLPPQLINFLGVGSETLLGWTPPLTDLSLKQPYIPFVSLIGSAYDAGLPADAQEMSPETLTILSERRDKSIIVCRPMKSEIIIGRPHGYTIRDIYKGFYLIVEEPGKLPTLIVAGPQTAVLREDELPTMIREENRKRTKRPLLKR
jgi:hypothetical protein